MSEFLRIARCTLLLSEFVPKASALYKRMMKQGGSQNMVLKQIRKAVIRHPEPFKKYTSPPQQIIDKIIKHQ